MGTRVSIITLVLLILVTLQVVLGQMSNVAQFHSQYTSEAGNTLIFNTKFNLFTALSGIISIIIGQKFNSKLMIVLFVALMSLPQVFSATHNIEANSNEFLYKGRSQETVGLHIYQNDVINWSNLLSGNFTVVEVADGSATTTNGGFNSGAGVDTFQHTFTTTGTFYYVSTDQVGAGMRGSITVYSGIQIDASGSNFVPSNITVNQGSTVVFVGLENSTVVEVESAVSTTPKTGGFASAAVGVHPVFAVTLSTAGNLHYINGEDNTMRGAIVVEEFFYCFGKAQNDPTVCSGNGTCTATDTCTCTAPAGGNDCSEITCAGKAASDPNVCTQRGSCVSVDQCNCNTGYTGPDCEFVTCDGVSSNEPTVCSSHGMCIDVDTCQCNGGYTGAACNINVCFGLNATDANVCSGHGSCTAPDSCSCTGIFDDPQCATERTCNGVLANNATVCSGHGTCGSPDQCTCATGYTGSECQLAICDGISSNETSSCNTGSCTAPDTCDCPATHTGSLCQYPICFGVASNNAGVCSGHGTCNGPDSCSCSANYNGNNCDETTCFGIASTNATVCNGRGTCATFDTCTCNAGYGSTQCEQPTCGGIVATNGASCNGHGTCVDPDTCNCNPGYSGSFAGLCDTWTCGGLYNNDTNVCSAHGTCNSPDSCGCTTGYTGSTCQNAICYGIAGDQSNVCSGNGGCNAPDTCSCSTGWAGNQCQLPVCFGKPVTDPTVCNGNGTCVAPDNCTCSTQFVGDMCENAICYGLNGSNPTVCSGHGMCNAPDNCVCNNDWTGTQCETPICAGKPANDPNVCNSHGTCVSANTCQCTAPYEGSNCDNYRCFGLLNTDSNVCNGRGVCSSPENCTCSGSSGYGGNQCQFPICFGNLATDSGICSGHGTCVFPDQCACFGGYTDTNCQTPVCDNLPATDGNVCNGHGTCTGPNTCVCDGVNQYGGTFCAHNQCFGKLSNDPTVCSGHGSCNTPQTCTCQSGWIDNECQTKFAICFGLVSNDPNSCNSGQCVDPDTCACQTGTGGYQCELSYAANNKALYAWGRNDYYQFGNLTTFASNIFSKPTIAGLGDLEMKRNIIDVSFGRHHVIAVVTGGQVYGWGYNANYELGLGHAFNQDRPAHITGLSSRVITKVEAASTGCHSMFLTNQGVVFSSGCNPYGQAGVNPASNPVTTPTELKDAVEGKTIVSMGAGFRSSALCDSNGQLYTFGRRHYNQLADGSHSSSTRTTPYTVNMASQMGGQLCAKVASGYQSLMVLTQTGSLYTFGYGGYGQLMSGSSPSYFSTGHLVTGLAGQTITKMCSGLYHNFVLTDNGVVYGAGRNNEGALGLADNNVRNTPTVVGTSVLAGQVITDIDCRYATIVSTNNKRVYTFGRNNEGLLGYGANTPTNVNTAQRLFHTVDGQESVSVQMGETFAGALTEANRTCGGVQFDNPNVCRGHGYCLSGNGENGKCLCKPKWSGSNCDTCYGNRVNFPACDQCATGFLLPDCVRKDDVGSMFAWGTNNYGQIGNGTVVTSSYLTTPVPAALGVLRGSKTIQSMAIGEYHSIVISNGKVYGFGRNNYGMLGDGTTTTRSSPVKVNNLDGITITKVDSRFRHTLALSADGRVFSWGSDSHGQLGLVIGDTYNPIEVSFFHGLPVTDIAAGDYHSMASVDAGIGYSWGEAANGRIGNSCNCNTNYQNPIVMTGLNNQFIKRVFAGNSHSHVLLHGGIISAFGYSAYGQTGTGSTSSTINPTIVNGILLGKNVVDIKLCHDSSLVLDDAGVVYGYGRNNIGQLADGTTTQRNTPVIVGPSVFPSKQIVKIGCRFYTSFVVTNTGEIWMFGQDNEGEFGLKKFSTYSTQPIQLQNTQINGFEVIDISAGQHTGYAIVKSSRTCAGVDYEDENVCSGHGNCELGSGAGGVCHCNVGSPFIGANCNLCKPGFAGAECQYCDSGKYGPDCSRTFPHSGSVYAWGENRYGNFGNGTVYQNPFFSTPTLGALGPLTGKRNIQEIHAFELGSLVLAGNKVYGFGYNGNGELGDGTLTQRNIPTAINSEILNGLRVVKLSTLYRHVLALTETGRVFSWGDDQWGQLGLVIGDTSTPTEITTLQGIKIIDLAAGRHHSLSVTENGLVYSWGHRNHGRLGDGATSSGDYHTPILASILYNRFVVRVAAGDAQSMIVDQKGELYGFGYGGVGAIGYGGSQTSVYVRDDAPYQTTGLFTGRTVKKIKAVLSHTMMIGDDNKLYGMGQNSYGQLGDGTTTTRYSPVYVGSGTLLAEDIVDFDVQYHTIVLTASNKVYTFGRDNSAQIGTGVSGNNVLTPYLVQGVIADTTPLAVAASQYHSMVLADENRLCNGVAFDEPTVCAGHGLCAIGSGAAGQCICYGTSPFTGTNCDVCAQTQPLGQVTLTGPACDTCIGDYVGVDCQYRFPTKGSTYHWGHNQYGQFGNGTTTGSIVSTPTLSGLGDLAGKRNIHRIVAGDHFSLVLDDKFDIWGYGYNNYLVLGDETSTQRNLPVKTHDLVNIKVIKVQARYRHSCALSDTGRVFCWGNDEWGQLGLVISSTGLPTEVVTLAGIKVVDVATAFHHTAAVTNTGTTYAWGYRHHGRLGDGSSSTGDYHTPILSTFVFFIHAVRVGAGGSHTHVISKDGVAYGWGYGPNGQLGGSCASTTCLTPTPVQGLVTGKKVIDMCHGTHYTLLRTSDNRVYGFGYNGRGALGDGTTTQRNQPIQIGGSQLISETFSAMGCYEHTIVVTTSGEVWTFGDNQYGQLGFGSASPSYSAIPMKLSGGPLEGQTILDVAAGSRFSIALGDFNRQCNGLQFDDPNVCNQRGPCSIGVGSSGQCACITSFESPFVGSGCAECKGNFIGVNCDSCAPGFYGADCERTFDSGHAVAWGRNDYGNFGNGTVELLHRYSTPSAAALSSLYGPINYIEASFYSGYVISDFKIFAFGRNRYGQLGDDTTIDRASPVAVLGLDGLKMVKVSSYNEHTVAITDTGRLFVWGVDDNGELGLSSLSNQHKPLENPHLIGIKFVDISAGEHHTIGCTNTGSVIGFGYRYFGRIADGSSSSSNQHTPVTSPVYSSLRIDRVYAGSDHSLFRDVDGKLYGNGYGGNGALGSACLSTNCHSVPYLMGGLVNGKKIIEACAGYRYSLMVTEDNELYGTGRNNYGQLADGTTNQRNNPVVVGPGTLSSKNIVHVACRETSIVVASDGTVYTFGYNNHANIGYGVNDVTSFTTPQLITEGLQGQRAIMAASSQFSMVMVNITRECGGVSFDDPSVCSGHGKCIHGAGAAGVCSCDIRYEGATCSQCSGQFTGTNCASCANGYLLPSCTEKHNPGVLVAWGSNNNGQFGNGTTVPDPQISTPTLGALGVLQAQRNIEDIAIGTDYALLLTTGGAVYAQGSNTNGKLGDGTSTQRNLPVRIHSVMNSHVITRVVAHETHSAVLTSEGRIFTFGSDSDGQLGVVTSSTAIPTEVITLTGRVMVDLAAGLQHTVAVTDDGQGYGWGRYYYGRLGNGNTGNSVHQTPVPMTYTTLVRKFLKRIYAGRLHTAALTIEGQVYAFGYGGLGAIGSGSSSASQHPTLVQGSISGLTMTDLCAGHDFTIAVTDSGKLYAWGYNNVGQLADSSTSTRFSPVISGGATLLTKTVVDINCNHNSVGVITSDGLIFFWGDNVYGEMGTGSSSPSYFVSPQLVTSYVQGQTPYKVFAGDRWSAALMNINRTCNGVEYDSSNVCGGHGLCSIGVGNAGVCTCVSPFQGSNCDECGGNFQGATCSDCKPGFYGVDCQRSFKSGALFSWGLNNYGQFGNGTVSSLISSPSQSALGTLARTQSIEYVSSGYYSNLVIANGKLFSFGRNNRGQLGLGHNTDTNLPTAVQPVLLQGLRIVKVDIFNEHTLALTHSGRVFSFGYDQYGQLGNTQSTTNIPHEIVTFVGIPIADIATGIQHSLAVSKSGIGYGFGRRLYGRLGNGVTSDGSITTPQTIVGALSGKFIKRVYAGDYHSCAITDEDKAFCFGYGPSGQIGNNAFSTSNNPVQIFDSFGGAKIVKMALGNEVTFAIMDNGRIYGWGRNSEGHLGDGTFSAKSIPTISGGGTLQIKTVVDIAIHRFGVAITSDNEVYAWGRNVEGGATGDGLSSANSANPILIQGPFSGQLPIQVSVGYEYASIIVNTTRSCNGISFDDPTVCNGKGTCLLGVGDAGTCQCPYRFPGTQCEQCLPQFTNYPACDQCIEGRYGADCTVSYTSGSLYAFGSNNYGQFGNGTTLSESSPPTLAALGDLAQNRNIQQFSSYYDHVMVLVDFKSYGFGRNTNGQLGIGTTGNKNLPVATIGLDGLKIVKVNGGRIHSMVLTDTGRVFSFGSDSYGRLGLVTSDIYTPTEITTFIGLPKVADISSGYHHSVATDIEGNAYGWGYRGHGRTGDGVHSTGGRETPYVATAMRNVFASRIYAGVDHTSVIDEIGQVWSYGYCAYGLGYGSSTTSCVQRQQANGILIGKTITQLCAGSQMTMAVDSTGQLYGWGRNDKGELGDGTYTVRYSPIFGGSAAAVVTEKIIKVSCLKHTLVVTDQGRLWAWGENANGQVNLGIITPTTQPVPQLLDGTPQQPSTFANQQIIDIDVSNTFTLVQVNMSRRCNGIEYDDAASCSGHGKCSLGEGDNGACVCKQDFPGAYCDQCLPQFTNYPTCDQCIPGFFGPDCLRAQKESGVVYGMGSNDYGQLGNGTTVPLPFGTTPTLGALGVLAYTKSIIDIIPGYYHMLVQTKDFKVYGMGRNNHGQLGDGSYVNRNLPVLMENLDSFEIIKVDTMESHSVMLTKEGRVFSVGDDSYGRLGLVISSTNTPHEITNIIGLPPVKDVATGTWTTLLAMNDGTIYSSGRTIYGILGNGQTSDSSRDQPILATAVANAGLHARRVFAGYDASSIITDQQTVYSFGYCGYGLGYGGSTTHCNNPVRATGGGFETKLVTKISHCFQSSAVITTDGQLWGWGRNHHGQMGDGTTSTRTTPIRPAVTALNGKFVIDISCVSTTYIAATQTGEVYMWGRNTYGAFGGYVNTQSPDPSLLPVLIPQNNGPFTAQRPIKVAGGVYYAAVLANVTRYCNGVEFDNPTVCSGHGDCDLGTGDQGQCICSYPFTGQNCDQCFGNRVGTNCDQCAEGFYGVSCEFSFNTGSMYVFGSNRYGQFGNGSTLNSPLVSTATLGFLGDLEGLHNIEYVSAGWEHTVVLVNGKVYTAGRNDLGQLGDSTTLHKSSPVAPAGLSSARIVKIDTHTHHTVALSNNGRVWTWGYSNYGQLGIGTTTNSPIVREVVALLGIKIVDVGAGESHTMAVRDDGSMYGWGRRLYGRLGQGSTSDSYYTSPQLATQFNQLFVTSVAVGDIQTMTVTFSGQIYGVGYCAYSLGHGTTGTNCPTPVLVQGLMAGKTVKKLCSGYRYSVVIANDNRAYGWGWNGQGQLGDTTTTHRYSPIIIGGAALANKLVADIACHTSTLVITTVGDIFTFGHNDEAQLGTGTVLPSPFYATSPQSLGHPFTGQQLHLPFMGRKIGGIIVNSTRTCSGIPYDNPTVCSGHGKCSVGSGSAGVCQCDRNYAGSNCDKCSSFRAGYPACDFCIAGFEGAECTQRKDGLLFAMGDNGADGQFGDSSVIDSNVPTPSFVTGPLTGLKMNAFAAGNSFTVVAVDGVGYGAGTNSQGQLGTGDYVDSSTPVKFQGPVNSKKIIKLQAGNQFSIALSDDGKLYSAGYNGYYGLGRSTTSNDIHLHSEITGNLADKLIVDFSTQRDHVLSCDQQGVVWGWGRRDYGALATSSSCTNCYHTTPTNINGNNQLSGIYITKVAAGYDHSLYLTFEGQVYASGRGTYGQIGIGNTNTYNTQPVHVAALAGQVIVEISAGTYLSFAVTATGTLYGWGRNNYGSLGDGTTLQRTSPVIVGASTFSSKTIKRVATRDGTLVMTDEPQLYAIGRNSVGQLGIGSTTDTTLPVVVGGLLADLPITDITMNNAHSLVFSSNGTDIVQCFGIAASESAVCNGHGTCISSNNCQCQSGYGSADCSQILCYGVLSGAAGVCSGHGTCTGPDTCDCAEGFSGNDCSTSRICYGIPVNDLNVCSGHGLCVADDQCNCTTGYVTSNCSVPTCYGFEATDSNVCSGHGTCGSPDSCACSSGYVTDNCAQPTCFGIVATDNNVCSGHGSCVSPDSCTCSSGYTSSSCNEPTCFGIGASQPSSVCSGHGTCTAPDTCVCSGEYLSSDCSFNCTPIEYENSLQSIEINPDVKLQFQHGGMVYFNISQPVYYRVQNINVTVVNDTEAPSTTTYNDACDYNNMAAPYYVDAVTEQCHRDVVANIPFTEFVKCSGLNVGFIDIPGRGLYYLYSGVFSVIFDNPYTFIASGVPHTLHKYTFVKKRFSVKLQKEIQMVVPLNVTSIQNFFAAAITQRYNYATNRLEIKMFFVGEITGNPTYSLVYDQKTAGPHPVTVSPTSFTCPGTFESRLGGCHKFLVEIDNEGECTWQEVDYTLQFHVACASCFIENTLVFATLDTSMSDVCEVIDEKFGVTGSMNVYADSARSVEFPFQGISANVTLFMKADLSAVFAPIKYVEVTDFYICSHTASSCTDPNALNVLTYKSNHQLSFLGQDGNFQESDSTQGNAVTKLFQVKMGFTETAIAGAHLNTSDGAILLHANFRVAYEDDQQFSSNKKTVFAKTEQTMSFDLTSGQLRLVSPSDDNVPIIKPGDDNTKSSGTISYAPISLISFIIVVFLFLM